MPVAKTAKLLILACTLSISACQTVNWYGQAVSGQLSLLVKRQNIDQLLQKNALDSELRVQLRVVKSVRQFAEHELKLPVGKTFTSYVDLQREPGKNYVVWNVFAAPEFSLDPHQWCYPIAGCAQYRGYFSEAAAQRFAHRLKQKTFDAAVAGVAAYSTLGWFADPVLSTFIHYPEQRLASLLFHELAHKVLYIADDTEFNESFASSVEAWGLQSWLRSQGREHELQRFDDRQHDRAKFLEIVDQLRAELAVLYEDTAMTDDQKRARKERLFSRYRAKSGQLMDPYFQRWLASIDSNASLVPIQSYARWTGAFTELIERHNGDMAAFYAAVTALGELPAEQRVIELQYLTENAIDAVPE